MQIVPVRDEARKEADERHIDHSLKVLGHAEAIDGVAFRIVWEADLLVNIGEQGMAG